MSRKRNRPVDELVDLAVLLFLRGYHATSIRELEHGLDTRRASLYHAFTSKRELFLRALRRVIARVCCSLPQPLQESAAAPAAAIAAVLEPSDADDGLLLTASVDLAAHDDEVARLILDACTEMERSFQALIEHGRRDGHVDAAVDPTQAAKGATRALPRPARAHMRRRSGTGPHGDRSALPVAGPVNRPSP